MGHIDSSVLQEFNNSNFLNKSSLKHVNLHIIPALLRYENFIIEIEIIELYIWLNIYYYFPNTVAEESQTSISHFIMINNL